MQLKHKHKISVTVGAIVIFLILYSCSGEPVVDKKPRVFEGYGIWMDTVLKSPDKALRGLEPGMSAEDIKKAEVIAPTEEDSASLYYEIKADSVTDVSINYVLAENKLEEIEMRISSKTKDAGATVLADLKKYFETKYPGPVTQKGVIVYSGKTTDGSPLKISLDDQSGLDDGLVSLLVYREQ